MNFLTQMPRQLTTPSSSRSGPRSHLRDLYDGVRMAYKHRKTIQSWAKSAAASVRRGSSASMPTIRSIKSSRSGPSNAVTKLSGLSTRLPYKKVSKGSRPKPRGTKRVKISSEFRKKVKLCEQTNKLDGYFQANYAAQQMPTPVTNRTAVSETMLCPQVSNGSVFSYGNVLHAASRLWNGKASTPTPTNSDTNNFDARTTIIDVHKQWAVMRFKNNTLRTIRIKHMLFSPKSTQNIHSPKTAWENGLYDMISSGRVIGTPAVTINSLFIHPNAFDQVKQFYSSSETDYTLEPGQAIQETIQGPSMTYDGGKFLANSQYMYNAKQDVYSLVIVQYDLAVGNAPSTIVGYPNEPGPSVTLGNSLLIQSTYHCQLSMPEPTGWVSSGAAPAAGVVMLGKRQKMFCYDEFNSTTTAETAYTREDEQNPF